MPDQDPFKKYGGKEIAKQDDPFAKYGGTSIEEQPPIKKKEYSGLFGGVQKAVDLSLEATPSQSKAPLKSEKSSGVLGAELGGKPTTSENFKVDENNPFGAITDEVSYTPDMLDSQEVKELQQRDEYSVKPKTVTDRVKEILVSRNNPLDVSRRANNFINQDIQESGLPITPNQNGEDDFAYYAKSRREQLSDELNGLAKEYALNRDENVLPQMEKVKNKLSEVNTYLGNLHTRQAFNKYNPEISIDGQVKNIGKEALKFQDLEGIKERDLKDKGLASDDRDNESKEVDSFNEEVAGLGVIKEGLNEKLHQGVIDQKTYDEKIGQLKKYDNDLEAKYPYAAINNLRDGLSEYIAKKRKEKDNFGERVWSDVVTAQPSPSEVKQAIKDLEQQSGGKFKVSKLQEDALLLDLDKFKLTGFLGHLYHGSVVKGGQAIDNWFGGEGAAERGKTREKSFQDASVNMAQQPYEIPLLNEDGKIRVAPNAEGGKKADPFSTATLNNLGETVGTVMNYSLGNKGFGALGTELGLAGTGERLFSNTLAATFLNHHEALETAKKYTKDPLYQQAYATATDLLTGLFFSNPKFAANKLLAGAKNDAQKSVAEKFVQAIKESGGKIDKEKFAPILAEWAVATGKDLKHNISTIKGLQMANIALDELVNHDANRDRNYEEEVLGNLPVDVLTFLPLSAITAYKTVKSNVGVRSAVREAIKDPVKFEQGMLQKAQDEGLNMEETKKKIEYIKGLAETVNSKDMQRNRVMAISPEQRFDYAHNLAQENNLRKGVEGVTDKIQLDEHKKETAELQDERKAILEGTHDDYLKVADLYERVLEKGAFADALNEGTKKDGVKFLAEQALSTTMATKNGLKGDAELITDLIARNTPLEIKEKIKEVKERHKKETEKGDYVAAERTSKEIDLLEAGLEKTKIPKGTPEEITQPTELSTETPTQESSTRVEEGSGGVGGDVESTTKALEDISKNKPTIWQSVKDAFNKGVNKVFGGSLKMKDSEKLSPDKIKVRVELIAQKLGATIEYKPHPLGAAFNIANDGKFYITIDPKLFDKGLGNQEAFNTINVIAHELGHAIDAKEVLKNNLSDTEISELAKLHRAFINTFNFDVGEDISGLETAIKNNNKNITGDEKATKISDLRNPETNAHRHEQEELFADALRMMVISPELAKRLAPNLFERLSKHGLGDNEHQSIAEAYHDAKSKGIENDFTKAVEQSLKEQPKAQTPTQESSTRVEAGSGGVGGDVGQTFETGKPITVFHGTTQNFETFDAEKRGSATHDEDTQFGTFFSDTHDEANKYTKGNGRVIKAELNLKNPLVVDVQKIGGNKIELIKKAIADGHDGIVFENILTGKNKETGEWNKHTEYIVFDNDAVKILEHNHTPEQSLKEQPIEAKPQSTPQQLKESEGVSGSALKDVVPVFHHTKVDVKDFDFGNFQRGKNQVSQFGDGLAVSTDTTPFLQKRYGNPIKGEVKDSDFVVIDTNKTEKEIYEELKSKGYKFNKPDGGSYIGNDPAKEYDGTEKANEQPAIISLFNDFQKSNPEVKGVKIVNHIIANEKVSPFYVIYDNKSFYGEGSLKAPTQYTEAATPAKKESGGVSGSALKDVGDVEYNDFIDKGKVSEERLNDIAEKVKTQQPLSDREKEIFTDKTAEINKIISKAQTPTQESSTRVEEGSGGVGGDVVDEKVVKSRVKRIAKSLNVDEQRSQQIHDIALKAKDYEDFKKQVNDLIGDNKVNENRIAEQYDELREEAKSEYEKELERNLEDLRASYGEAQRADTGLKKITDKSPSSVRNFINRILNGTTPESVAQAKARLVEMQRKYRKEKAEMRAMLPRERGVNFVIEKLSKAARNGDITQEGADLAIDLIRKQPNMFEDLAISITKGNKELNGDGVQGWYRAADALVKIFKNPKDPLTATHELLHHTERYLPQEVRDGITQEWHKQIQIQASDIAKKLKTETNVDKRQQLTQGLLYLGLAEARQIEPNSANVEAMERIMSKYLGDHTDSKGNFHKGLGYSWYQLYNPSEWWAVNASKIFRDAQNKPELKTWVDKAKAFYNYLIDSAKKIFKGNPTANVEKGLRTILKGEALEDREGTMLSQSKRLLNIKQKGSFEDRLKSIYDEVNKGKAVEQSLKEQPIGAGKEPPKIKPEVVEGEGDEWTAVRKEKQMEINAVKDAYEKQKVKGWSESMKIGLEKVQKMFPTKKLYDAAATLMQQIRLGNGHGDLTRDEALATMHYLKREIEAKRSDLYKEANSDNQIERDVALMQDDTLRTEYENTALAIKDITTEAGRTLSYAQAELRLDPNYGLQIRKMQLMRAKGNEKLTPEEEKWVNDKWEQEKEIIQKENNIRFEKLEEEFNAKIDELQKKYDELKNNQTPKTPQARQKKSQSLKDLAQKIRTQNELDKFSKKGLEGGLDIQSNSLFGNIDFKELSAQAIEYIAKGVEKGERLADLILQAAKKFKKDFDEKEFAKAINTLVQKASMTSKEDAIDNIKDFAEKNNLSDITSEMVSKNLVRDYVDSHIGEVEKREIFKEAFKDLKKILPDITEEKLKEAYLKQGDYKQETKRQLESNIKEGQQSLRKIAKSELTADQQQKIKLENEKRNTERNKKEFERKLNDEEYEEPVPIKLSKKDAELIRLKKEQSTIEEAYRKKQKEFNEKNKSGLERAADFVRSSYVAILIGSPKTLAKVALMSVMRPLSEVATKLTFGKVFNAFFPNISKAAMRGGEGSNIRDIKKGFEAYFKQMGDKGMERMWQKANDEYDIAAKTYYDYKSQSNADPKRVEFLKKKMNDKLIKVQGSFIYKFIGGSSIKDALKALVNRSNEIEKQFGKVEGESIKDGNWLDKINYVAGFIGRSHSAAKTFSGRFSFAAGFMARLEGAVRNGEDISQPNKVLEIAHESYLDWERGKYQQSNAISDLWNKWINSMSKDETGTREKVAKSAQALAKTEVAITRVPVNILHEAVMEYTLGAFRAAILGTKEYVKARKEVKESGILTNSPEFKAALKERISQMDEKQAATIARCFRKGGLGVGLYALALISGAINFGIFPHMGQKKKKEDDQLAPEELNPGQIMVGDTKLGETTSGIIEHIPALWTTFMGLGMAQSYKDAIKNGKSSREGVADAIFTHLKIIEGSIPQSKIISPTNIFKNVFRTVEKKASDAGLIEDKSSFTPDQLKDPSIKLLIDKGVELPKTGTKKQYDIKVVKDDQHEEGQLTDKEFEDFKKERNTIMLSEIKKVLSERKYITKEDEDGKVISSSNKLVKDLDADEIQKVISGLSQAEDINERAKEIIVKRYKLKLDKSATKIN